MINKQCIASNKGAKTAQRIILDLKDKMGALAAASGVDPIARGPVLEEASAALEVLGYSPKQSERILWLVQTRY